MYGLRSLRVGTSLADFPFSKAHCCLAPSSCRRLSNMEILCALLLALERLGMVIAARNITAAAAASGTSQRVLRRGGAANCFGATVLKCASNCCRRWSPILSGAECEIDSSVGLAAV